MNRRITAALLLLSAFLPGCAGKTQAAPANKLPTESAAPPAQKPSAAPPAQKPPAASAAIPSKPPVSGTGPQAAEGRELYARVETREAAEELAALYGIELVDYSYGIATFHTEEDPREVIRRGEDEGWPKIALNQVKHLN